MSQKRVTIHDNEYEKIKSNKPKKPKWATEGAASFFISFAQRSDQERKMHLADKRLAVAGLSTEILNQKYGNDATKFMALSDLKGICLWVNELMRQFALKTGVEPIMEPVRGTYLSHLKENKKFGDLMQKLEKETPQTLELNNIPLSDDTTLLSLKYVG